MYYYFLTKKCQMLSWLISHLNLRCPLNMNMNSWLRRDNRSYWQCCLRFLYNFWFCVYFHWFQWSCCLGFSWLLIVLSNRGHSGSCCNFSRLLRVTFISWNVTSVSVTVSNSCIWWWTTPRICCSTCAPSLCLRIRLNLASTSISWSIQQKEMQQLVTFGKKT